MRILVLRFDAPLISLGAPIIDNYGEIQQFPALSMLTGLLANTLGYDHSDYDRLNKLQSRIIFAARQEIPGKKIRDYQTADLNQDYMNMNIMGWTTYNKRDNRKGRSASRGTHTRYRDYLADSVITVFVTLSPENQKPTIDNLIKALLNPERPLFIGRKCCIPSSSILADVIDGYDLLEALKYYPLFNRERMQEYVHKKNVFAQWPDEKKKKTSPVLSIMDKREWQNQIHCGERLVRQGNIRLDGESSNV
ncbi:MAG: type I-E CRISPR-associated protein Cas5/CasD [Candidatus Krumholzibacteriales bacterium]